MFDLFIFFNEQNISNQSSLVIGLTGFLSSSKLMYLVFLLESLLSFLVLKIFDFGIIAYRTLPLFFLNSVNL